MVRSDLDFGDRALSGEERLASYMALERGFVLALEALFSRIGAYSDILEEEYSATPAAAGYLADTRAAVRKAVDWLQLITVTVRGEDREEHEALDFRLLLEGTVKRMRKVLADEESLILNLPDADLAVSGSLFQLQELLMKITQMFVARHADGAAPIHITTAQVGLDTNFFTLLRSRCPAGQYIVLTLGSSAQDTFQLEQQQRFLDVFLDSYSQGNDEDFILLQVYGMIMAHRGEIFFQPAAAGGYAINLALPGLAAREDMLAPHNIDDRDLRGKETILLVDDEDMIWDVIIDMLQELGYSVLLAENGSDAIQIYGANAAEIDLVLLDMVMPGVDGHEAFFRLKEIDPKVRVLLSSGYVSEDDARDVLDAGAVGFLHKPYRILDLARRVREIFDNRSA